MGIENKEVQARDIRSIFNNIRVQNFTNLEKEMLNQVQEPWEIQTDMTKIESSHRIS
jgi:hypothetical protein